ncbi:ras-related protein Rab-30-like [Actinia tenebrosa]|uniref:Ras-related protein Rab-30-like n=1 Tax=Actinia tenebrosa TaxID=6105 RepID=A0A6P8GYL7_ACTTE|nr:ras-related protein Rab-30-like [Actinia tenebrosa]
MEDYSYLFKIILVGDANVGKTCLVRQFTKGYFPPNQGPTIGVDFTIKTVEVDNEKVKLQIWDTAGQERFRSITQSYYHNADGVIITYDITNEKSFESVPQWSDDANRYTSKEVLMAIVGNKSDLANTSRKVNFKCAEELAQKENTVALETSAKEANNVDLLFMSLATHLKRNVKSEDRFEGRTERDTSKDGLINGISLSRHNIYPRGPISCCRV